MSKGRIALILGSVAAIITSGLTFAMWMANGIVYGSLVGLKGREQDLVVARERAAVALTAAIFFQAVAIFTTASWLPRMQLTGILGTTLRLALGLAISLVGAGLTLALVLQVIRVTH
ncbi:MAG: hypothetical protein LC126_14760 [Bryobacterales bacterium]|nr:hypothetical protein [Bryobacterales bacterium]